MFLKYSWLVLTSSKEWRVDTDFAPSCTITTLPLMYQPPIPFPASMDRQMLLLKGGEPGPSSLPMVIQPSLCVEA